MTPPKAEIHTWWDPISSVYRCDRTSRTHRQPKCTVIIQNKNVVGIIGDQRALPVPQPDPADHPA